jgi:hypothetical protein
MIQNIQRVSATRRFHDRSRSRAWVRIAQRRIVTVTARSAKGRYTRPQLITGSATKIPTQRSMLEPHAPTALIQNPTQNRRVFAATCRMFFNSLRNLNGLRVFIPIDAAIIIRPLTKSASVTATHAPTHGRASSTLFSSDGSGV